MKPAHSAGAKNKTGFFPPAPAGVAAAQQRLPGLAPPGPAPREIRHRRAAVEDEHRDSPGPNPPEIGAAPRWFSSTLSGVREMLTTSSCGHNYDCNGFRAGNTGARIRTTRSRRWSSPSLQTRAWPTRAEVKAQTALSTSVAALLQIHRRALLSSSCKASPSSGERELQPSPRPGQSGVELLNSFPGQACYALRSPSSLTPFGVVPANPSLLIFRCGFLYLTPGDGTRH